MYGALNILYKCTVCQDVLLENFKPIQQREKYLISKRINPPDFNFNQYMSL